MSNDQELEVKFYLSDLPALEKRLKSVEAQIDKPRVMEINLRFDTPDGELTNTARVLRLRKDTRARVTYKGPGQVKDGVQQRLELEFTVSDFDITKALFEALGYQVWVIYEKYRTTYKLDQVEVTLDEMPFGNFAEIEGPDGSAIQAAARKLGLDWEQRILVSYLALFDQARASLGFNFRDLTFENFKGLHVNPQDLEVKPAE